MSLKTLFLLVLASALCPGQTPAGRWDGTIVVGSLKVPLRIDFEGAGQSFSGSFVNGDARVRSTSGSFSDGVLRLSFDAAGTRLEATTLADGGIKGAYGSPSRGMNSFTAAAYCTCSYEGEAGPEIMGDWEVPGAGWQLTVRRKGEDTFATVSFAGGSIGPLNGRFDGAGFMLHYFDGTRAALLEIEPRKDESLHLVWNLPGEAPKTLQAIRRKSHP